MFIFPMAGVSRRFSEAGYTLPKYMLQAGGTSVFKHVLNGFRAHFDAEPFLFICRDVAGTVNFVKTECAALGIKNMQIVTLAETTRGQAETVQLGLERAGVDANTPITIFNIDTIHAGFQYPPTDVMTKADGALEVFRGQGDAWSFARTKSDADMTVLETAEKRRISPLCSSGLYYFRSAKMFSDAYAAELHKPQASELYIAPLYNHLIKLGLHVVAFEVSASALTPCGIPAEYEAFKLRVG